VGATVTARNDFPTGFKGISQQHGCALDRVDIGVIIDKFRQGIGRFVQFTTNKVVVHEEPLVIVNLPPRSVTDRGKTEKHCQSNSSPVEAPMRFLMIDAVSL
jgi:hypothetical protein